MTGHDPGRARHAALATSSGQLAGSPPRGRAKHAAGALYIVLPRDSQTFMYVVLLYNLFMPTLYLELVNESGGIYMFVVALYLFFTIARGFAPCCLFSSNAY